MMKKPRISGSEAGQVLSYKQRAQLKLYPSGSGKSIEHIMEIDKRCTSAIAKWRLPLRF